MSLHTLGPYAIALKEFRKRRCHPRQFKLHLSRVQGLLPQYPTRTTCHAPRYHSPFIRVEGRYRGLRRYCGLTVRAFHPIQFLCLILSSETIQLFYRSTASRRRRMSHSIDAFALFKQQLSITVETWDSLRNPRLIVGGSYDSHVEENMMTLVSLIDRTKVASQNYTIITPPSSKTIIPPFNMTHNNTNVLFLLGFTSDSPSRATGLTRSLAVRTRRNAASSLSYSSSYLSGEESLSDKDNGSGNTQSRSYSEYSRDDGFSTLERYSRSSNTRLANGTPRPSSSSDHSPESEEDLISATTPPSSTRYETTHSPSIISFASPSIPSLYEIAPHRF